MKFLSVRELRGKSAQVWKDLSREKEMVVTNNGHPVALLTAVDEDSVEESLAAWRKVRAVQAITSIQEASMEAGRDRLSREDIEAEIRTARKARRKRSG